MKFGTEAYIVGKNTLAWHIWLWSIKGAGTEAPKL